MTEVQFGSFALHDNILRVLAQEKYLTPTPIQAAAIPELLAGRDLMGTAQTGTGKTAAFALPILHRLNENRPAQGAARGIRALILTPTRELAVQIDDNLKVYGRNLRIASTVVMGGVPMGRQIRAMQRMPEILVATPGRLIDLMGQGVVRLNQVETLVLDEADRMLDMGFLPAVKRIVQQISRERQTIMFSATMAREIEDLAAALLRNPVRVEIRPTLETTPQIDQRFYFVKQEDKRLMLSDMISKHDIRRGIVFTRTKHRADRVAEALEKLGIPSEAIHSNKSQNARQRSLQLFDQGRVRMLVATDIVARGIDVDGITHIINFDLPNEAENYVHRIGRTARAGKDGVAISFCDHEEIGFLKEIVRVTKQAIVADQNHEYHSASAAEAYEQIGQAKSMLPRRPFGGHAPRGKGYGGGHAGGDQASYRQARSQKDGSRPRRKTW